MGPCKGLIESEKPVAQPVCSRERDRNCPREDEKYRFSGLKAAAAMAHLSLHKHSILRCFSALQIYLFISSQEALSCDVQEAFSGCYLCKSSFNNHEKKNQPSFRASTPPERGEEAWGVGDRLHAAHCRDRQSFTWCAWGVLTGKSGLFSGPSALGRPGLGMSMSAEQVYTFPKNGWTKEEGLTS